MVTTAKGFGVISLIMPTTMAERARAATKQGTSSRSESSGAENSVKDSGTRRWSRWCSGSRSSETNWGIGWGVWGVGGVGWIGWIGRIGGKPWEAWFRILRDWADVPVLNDVRIGAWVVVVEVVVVTVDNDLSSKSASGCCSRGSGSSWCSSSS